MLRGTCTNKEVSLGDRESKCQIMVEEKSISFGLSPSSMDQYHLDDNLCHVCVLDE